MRRVGRVVTAVVIYWLAGAVSGVVIYVGIYSAEPLAWVIPGLGIWVGGVWCAWRVGSSRWGLWRGRRGHPVLAFFIAFSVAVSVSVAFGLFLPNSVPSWAVKVVPFVLFAICVGVFWSAWRIGSRRWGEPAPFPPPAAPTAVPVPTDSSRPTSPPAAVAGNSPVRFYASRSAPVLASGTGQPIGSLERNGEYAAVGTFGGWVLIEDGSRRQGWVPDSSIPTRVWRRIPALAPVPPSPPAPDPAVFAPCPGCGRTVNRQVGCCPYCQAVVEGGQ